MTLIREHDFGTPAKPGPATVTVQVDGYEVTVPEGTSIMRAAATAGIDIPKLCATDTLGAFGSCRLCLVEVDGRRGTPASCTTPCSDGMSVKTQTPKVVSAEPIWKTNTASGLPWASSVASPVSKSEDDRV